VLDYKNGNALVVKAANSEQSSMNKGACDYYEFMQRKTIAPCGAL
jgi:hypothetical protein